jgi:hypothetical protein
VSGFVEVAHRAVAKAKKELSGAIEFMDAIRAMDDLPPGVRIHLDAAEACIQDAMDAIVGVP